MIKRLIKRWIIIALKQFYYEITIKGEDLVEQGPLLIVSNHPNNLLDPLIITYVYPQTLWYLAKSTAFKGVFVAKILRALRMLPVYRRQDVGEDTVKNEETFLAVTRELSRSESILIFPEGVSTGERRLSKIKTGAARIVLQAEALSDFCLGLKIQPVGITYSNTGGFKTSVAVRIGKPLEVSDWQDRYERDPIAAVKELTESIEREIRKVTVEVIRGNDDGLVEQIAWLYRSAGRVVDEHEGYQLIAKNLELLQDQGVLRQKVFAEIASLRSVAERLGLAREQLVVRNFSALDLLILGPVILLGVLINYLPYKFLVVLAGRDSQKILTGTSRSFAIALFLFPVWYACWALLAIKLGLALVFSVTLWLSLFFIGHITNKYWQSCKLLIYEVVKFAGLSSYTQLITQRDRLLIELDRLRVE